MNTATLSPQQWAALVRGLELSRDEALARAEAAEARAEAAEAERAHAEALAEKLREKMRRLARCRSRRAGLVRTSYRRM
jgi:hypothetical protein